MCVQGTLPPDAVKGLFLHGPAYRGTLSQPSPTLQDKRAACSAAFERLHLLDRDDDVVHRLGLGDSRDWKTVYKGLTNALNAHIVPGHVVFRFDPSLGRSPGHVVVPLTLQESLTSLGGALPTLLPLLLRLGGTSSWTLIPPTLNLLRDSIRGSDRARFAFRLSDGHRVVRLVPFFFSPPFFVLFITRTNTN